MWLSLWLAACDSPPTPPPAQPQQLVAPAPPAPAAFRLAQDQGAVWLSGPDGQRLAQLSPLAVQGDELSPLQVTLGANGLSASLVQTDLRWSLELLQPSPQAPWLALQVQVEVLSPIQIQHLGLRLRLVGPATSLDRAYRELPVDQPRRVGPWTPQRVRSEGLLLDAHAPGLAVWPEADDAVVELVLDDASLHPFRTYTACLDQPHHPPPRRDRGAILWQPGQRLSASARLYLGSPALPLPRRYPRSFDAALVFTDHADQSRVDKLGALMYGEGWRGADQRHAAGKGFAGRGLSMTKSVFARQRSWYAKQLDDPAFVALSQQLLADGVALGPHSITGVRDDAAALQRGLDRFDALGSVSWIDHQPDTNCEAISNQGWAPGRWQITPALQAHGYRYLWANEDLEIDDPIDLFDPDRAEAFAPVLWQHPDVGHGLWLFPSLWRAMDRPDFLRAYRPDNLDRLQAQQGLHIAHTYLDTFADHPEVGGWTLLRPGGRGFVLRDDADALFADLQARQQAGALWVSSLGAMADHLRASFGVSLGVEAPDILTLSTSQPVSGFALSWPGLKPANPGLHPVGDVLWLDLSAGTTRLPFPGLLGPATLIVEAP